MDQASYFSTQPYNTILLIYTNYIVNTQCTFEQTYTHILNICRIERRRIMSFEKILNGGLYFNIKDVFNMQMCYVFSSVTKRYTYEHTNLNYIHKIIIKPHQHTYYYYKRNTLKYHQFKHHIEPSIYLLAIIL